MENGQEALRRIGIVESQIEEFRRRFDDNDDDHRELRRQAGKILGVSWSILVALVAGLATFALRNLIDGAIQ